jgi:hypothetical protein
LCHFIVFHSLFLFNFNDLECMYLLYICVFHYLTYIIIQNVTWWNNSQLELRKQILFWSIPVLLDVGVSSAITSFNSWILCDFDDIWYLVQLIYTKNFPCILSHFGMSMLILYKRWV